MGKQHWIGTILKEFREGKGYVLTSLLPHLREDVGPSTPHIRFDYQVTISDAAFETLDREVLIPMVSLTPWLRLWWILLIAIFGMTGFRACRKLQAQSTPTEAVQSNARE